MDKETLVQDVRTGTNLYVDLIIKHKESGQLYALEIKTVWAADVVENETPLDLINVPSPLPVGALF